MAKAMHSFPEFLSCLFVAVPQKHLQAGTSRAVQTIYPFKKFARLRETRLGQHRTILSAGLRRQIFRRMKQKPQPILCGLTRIFVK